jgi:hypothetical protein
MLRFYFSDTMNLSVLTARLAGRLEGDQETAKVLEGISCILCKR